MGVLIMGGARLERLAEVRCVAFDKTGTLTRGELQVVDVAATDGVGSLEVLRLAASLELRSEHPIGRAIVERAQRDSLPLGAASAFQSLPGLGAEGLIGSERIVVGNHRLFEARGLCSAAAHARLEDMAAAGCTAVMVARDQQTVGIIGVADEPREAAKAVVEMIRGQGVEHVVLLTGDHELAAKPLAASLGITEYRASLLPADKVAAVEELKRQYGVLAMVGDGVNDAPALATADVGIAMGVAGSDAALETADVALMADELPKIPFAIRLSRAASRNIRMNIAFSLVLKGAFLAMAFAGTATLWMAVVADMGASLIVIANALRLLRE
jgi:Cd2+/Zn2+-exporting ATPase